MVKWLKITENQYFGFWMLGLVLFALQEVPYMLMPFLKLKTNPIMNMQETFVFLDVCEKILGSLCVFLMTFVIQKNVGFWNLGERNGQIGFGLAVVVLLLNYLGWGMYFHGFQPIWVMLLFIVVLPPIYYVCIGLWRQNWPLIFNGILFLAVHFTHVFCSLKR